MARDESQSFSAGVKDELIRMPMGKSCCQLSLFIPQSCCQ